MIRLSLPAALAAALLPAAGPASADDAKAAAPQPKKKIVLIAGKKSHGPVGNGQHDYGWSVLLLKAVLESSNVADRVRVDAHLDGWPADPKAVEDADTIMIVSDGRDGDKYSEALHVENDERVALVDRLAKRGCGIVTFHFSTFAPQRHADKVLDWTGGYFQWETDGKRKWYSAIRHLKGDVKVAAAEHPVARGLPAGFPFADEFYYRIRFRGNDSRLTPILQVPALGGTPLEHTVAWAVQRADGGRGFGTTAGHGFAGWADDHFRRLICNALVWTAGLDVPAGGVESRHFGRDEIRRLVGAPPGDPGAAPQPKAAPRGDAGPLRVPMLAGGVHSVAHRTAPTARNRRTSRESTIAVPSNEMLPGTITPHPVVPTDAASATAHASRVTAAMGDR